MFRGFNPLGLPRENDLGFTYSLWAVVYYFAHEWELRVVRLRLPQAIVSADGNIVFFVGDVWFPLPKVQFSVIGPDPRSVSHGPPLQANPGHRS